MAKRFRQASLFDTISSKKRHHKESGSISIEENEGSLSTDAPLDSGMA